MAITSTIITVNDPENYGNRLQNYALKILLEEYGPVSTAYCSGYKPIPAEVARVYHPAVAFTKRLLGGMKTGSYGIMRKHHSRCVEFTRKHVPADGGFVDVPFGTHPKSKTPDIYVLGSDQVWNCGTRPTDSTLKCLSLYLGDAVPSSSQVFSYAASIGLSEIGDGKARATFARCLPRLKAISVREYRAAELVKEMTGLDATVVLDPTLMLPADRWMEITEGFVPPEDRYVLTYFLGYPTDEQERDIQAYAKAHGCCVRRMLDLRDKETFVAGPQDSVELFSKAEYVFTDSYHACCFSMLFHKQFTVFNRAGMTGKSSMNSRMETLFRLFDLESIMMDSGLAPDIDYEKVDRLLARHREDSRAWLDETMKGSTK